MPEDSNTRPLSTGEWFLTMLVLAIPVVNVVMFFVWVFGAGNVNRRNYCRAVFIWFCIWLVFVVGFAVLGGGFAAFAAWLASMKPN